MKQSQPEQEDLKCKELPFNLEETMKIEQLPLYRKYKQWLAQNGVIMDNRLRYPAFFGQATRGVVGVGTHKPIEKNKAVVFVPYHLLITLDKAKAQASVMQIIKENTSYFKNQDAPLRMLLLFISREIIKGQQSFYYPYLSIVKEQFLAGWSTWTLYALQNPSLIAQMKKIKQSIQGEFMSFLKFYRRYEQVFPAAMTNAQYKEVFERAYNFIITRAFGWSLPSISLIPLADSFNHSNIRYVNHFLINTILEKDPNIDTDYYKKYSAKVNLNLLKDQGFNLSQEELAQLRKEKKSKVVKFIEKHKQLLASSEKVLGKEEKGVNDLGKKGKGELRKSQFSILHHQYKAGIHKIRNLHFYDSSCEQDNDTDEDEVINRQVQLEKLQLNDLQTTISEKTKKKHINKLWKLFKEDEEQEQEEEEEDEVEENSKEKEERRKELKGQIQQKLFKEEDSSGIESSDSDQDYQENQWVQNTQKDKTYFVMSTKGRVAEQEQLYNFYGRRSNAFLLSGYNFVLEDNIYDSFPLKLRLDSTLTTRVPASKLIPKPKEKCSRSLRIKRYRISRELIDICRSYTLLWNKQDSPHCRLVLPFNRAIETKTIELALEIVRHCLKQYSTSKEQDQELLQNQKLKYQQALAITVRAQHKKILLGQETLLNKCLSYLVKWQVGKVQKFTEEDFKWIRRLKPYLIRLESAKTL